MRLSSFQDRGLCLDEHRNRHSTFVYFNRDECEGVIFATVLRLFLKKKKEESGLVFTRGQFHRMCGWGLLLSVTAICAKYATPFHVPYSNIVPKRRMHLQTQMIFDFIKQRSVEGLQQVDGLYSLPLE